MKFPQIKILNRQGENLNDAGGRGGDEYKKNTNWNVLLQNGDLGPESSSSEASSAAAHGAAMRRTRTGIARRRRDAMGAAVHGCWATNRSFSKKVV